ncbi:hypothetical protein ABZ547_43720 [Streptomyces sparsogenes]|uniref:hypothetical protein n=1 Tax=Streptomyces sparsogenes TaxID=67365 RepID=UPI0033FCD1A9
MAASETATESDHPKSLINSPAQELWEDKDALGTFLNVIRCSEGFIQLAGTLERSAVRPAKPTFYGVKGTKCQS